MGYAVKTHGQNAASRDEIILLRQAAATVDGICQAFSVIPYSFNGYRMRSCRTIGVGIATSTQGERDEGGRNRDLLPGV